MPTSRLGRMLSAAALATVLLTATACAASAPSPDTTRTTEESMSPATRDLLAAASAGEGGMTPLVVEIDAAS